VHALTPLSAPPQAGQVGLSARLIQKYQLGGIEAGLLLAPAPPGFGDVGSVLFGGPECLFLYVSPIRAKT
jgi:hypothetical protein